MQNKAPRPKQLIRQLAFLFLIFTSLNALAQKNLKFWAGRSASTNLDSDWRISVGQLYLFDNDLALGSVQGSARLEYKVNKKLRIGLGYTYSSNSSDPDQPAKNRLAPRATYNFRSGKLRVANTFRTEWHFPERSKFEYRLRYRIKMHAGDWGLPLDITPFVSDEIHYYHGGKPFQYRDDEGEKLVLQSPNGFHAHRMQVGIRLRPFKRASVTLSFLQHREFNMGNKYRRLNVTDPRNGEVKRKFSNFSVLMASFSYRFKV